MAAEPRLPARRRDANKAQVCWRQLRRGARLACLLLAAGLPGAAAAAPTPAQRDQQVVERLRVEGRCVTSAQVIVCMQRGALAEVQFNAFATEAEAGAVAVRDYFGEMLDVPGGNHRRVEFYIADDVGIPHVTIQHEPWVFMHPTTIRRDMAPYLHELVHAMAQWSWRKSEWIAEGFANYAAAAVAREYGGYHRSFVLPEGLADLAEHFASPAGSEIWPLIGAAGRRGSYAPEHAALFRQLMADRRRYAPPFYALSWSFTEYLVERCGLQALRRIAESDAPDATSRAHCGRSLAQLKSAWRRTTLAPFAG